MKTLIHADWIVDFDINPIENGYIVVNGRNIEFYRHVNGNFDRKINVRGVVFPPFVNAHTHLEYSFLKFNPDAFPCFFDWLLWIIGNRRKVTEEEIKTAVRMGIDESKKLGTVYFGDISSFGISHLFKKLGFTYTEVIGKDMDISSLKKPLSIHSIYSVSPILARNVSNYSKGYRFQMHLGENPDEQSLVSCKDNQFESKVYPLLGRKRYEMPCAKNLVDYLKKIGLLNERLIAVHCTNLSRRELETLMQNRCSIVVCPRSNLNLKVGFPDLDFLAGYERLGIGTDGLSSNTSLSLIAEARTIYYVMKEKIPLREILRMMTIGGANALGIEGYRETPVFSVIKSNKKLNNPFLYMLIDPNSLEILDLRENQ